MAANVLEIITLGKITKMKNKPPFLMRWCHRYVRNWVDLICGMIGIITFGFYRPWWDIKFSCWYAKREINYIKKAREIKKK